MPYNISLHKKKKFSVSPTGTPLFNNWAFNPAPVLKRTYIIGGSTPAPVNIDTFIKNYLTDQNLTQVIVRANLISENEIGVGNVVVLSGAIADATPASPINQFDKSGYQITQNNLNVTTTLTFQNLQGLIEGVYGGVIHFQAYNVSSGLPKPILIGDAIYPYEVQVTKTSLSFVSPTKLTFSLLRNGVLPNPQTFNLIEPGNWFLKVDNKIDASAPNTVNNPSPSQIVLSGSGNKTVTIGLTEDLKTHPENSFETQVLITNSSGRSVFVKIVVNIFNDDGLEVAPTELCFEAVKGFTEASAQKVKIKGFGAFNITGPTWLNLSATSGINALDLIVTPLSANNLESAIYEGEIIISTNTKSYTVFVKYIVEGVVSTTLSRSDFNFTKALDFINIRDAARDENNLARLTLTAKVFDFITHDETVFEYDYVLPFFNYSAQIHIGEIVHRLLKKATSLTAFNYPNLALSEPGFQGLYKPALVDLKIEVFKRTNAQVLVTESFNNLKFVAGRKPKSFIKNAAILGFSAFHKRVTTNSKELFNFLLPQGVYEMFVKRNNEAPVLLASQNTDGNNIIRSVFDFSNYSVGDEISLQLKVGGTVFSKNYYIIPEEQNSWHIGYINQHYTLELFEFTGALTLISDIKKTTHTYYTNLIERIETLDSTNQMKLLINTGSIFKEDHLFITELINSKKCWLIFNEKQAIELDAVEKKLTNYDSEEEVYDYELEFNINRKHDVENYTF